MSRVDSTVADVAREAYLGLWRLDQNMRLTSDSRLAHYSFVLYELKLDATEWAMPWETRTFYEGRREQLRARHEHKE